MAFLRARLRDFSPTIIHYSQNFLEKILLGSTLPGCLYQAINKRIDPQVDLFVFHRSPQALDKDSRHVDKKKARSCQIVGRSPIPRQKPEKLADYVVGRRGAKPVRKTFVLRDNELQVIVTGCGTRSLVN